MQGMIRSVAEALLDPLFYSHRPSTVELIETHISRVYVAGEWVYKCKKPVQFDFLDFSTIELRRQACADEVRLNRRLAPNVYQGVVPVTEDDGVLHLDGRGQPVEWLVKMKRLPLEQTLEQMILRGVLSHADIERLAETLATFYRSLPPASISVREFHGNLLKHVQQNRSALLNASHYLPADQVRRVHELQLQLLHLQPGLFASRVSTGRVVEGHGDLRPEHICLSQPPVIFDCIEFSREFRTLDVADELAFLASECDHLGAVWVGPQLCKQCSLLLGDHVPAALHSFYKSYRACVRAKVAILRSEQLSGSEQQSTIAQARAYLTQAEKYGQAGKPPFLLVIGGLSGTGKSTLAMEIGACLGIEVLRTDTIRQEHFGRHAKQELNAGPFQPDMRMRVYDLLLQQAEHTLQKKMSVILDGTFERGEALVAAQALAKRLEVRFLAVQCKCPPEIAMERIQKRLHEGRDVSQANVEVYKQQLHSLQPWPVEVVTCGVDTTQPLEDQLRAVWGELREIA